MHPILKTICFITISFLFLHDSVAASGFPDALTTVDTLPVSSSTDTVKVFEKVEIEASVEAVKWIKHLEKKLQPVVEKAARKKMPSGTYTVNIRFLVEKDGSITDVVCMNDPGYGIAEGTVKVVQSGPHWNPGSIDGRPVRSYHTQPISFVISK